MPAHSKLACAAIAICLMAVVPVAALAQSFPPGEFFTVVTRNGIAVTDFLGDTSTSIGAAARDVVGEFGQGSAGISSDAAFLYFQLRVSDNPEVGGAGYAPFGWLVAIDLDGNLADYELLAMVNGGLSAVQLWQNTAPDGLGMVDDPAESLVASYPVSSHAQSIALFSGDFLLRWAVPVADLALVGFTVTTPIRLVFGANSNASPSLRVGASGDIAGAGLTMPTLNQIASDPVICGASGGCGFVDLPSITVGDAVSLETAGSIDFTVSLDQPPSSIATVAFATSDGTASAGTDYQMTAGTLTFLPGEVSKTISVPISDDAIDEPDETIFLQLGPTSGLLVAVGLATATIVDDDPAVAELALGLCLQDKAAREADLATCQVARRAAEQALAAARGCLDAIDYLLPLNLADRRRNSRGITAATFDAELVCDRIVERLLTSR